MKWDKVAFELTKALLCGVFLITGVYLLMNGHSEAGGWIIFVACLGLFSMC